MTFARPSGFTWGIPTRRRNDARHKIGTREEWQAARDELAKLEAEHAELGAEGRPSGGAQLPWVPVEKEYQFDTEDGKKTLAELFDGRSQLLAYNIMFGPDYEVGACPGCSNLGDELDGTRVHLNHRDVTLDLLLARADRSARLAYKERMGWQFPYVSTYGTEFPFDFGLALTPEQAQEIPEVQEMVDDPPSGSQEWASRSEPSSRTACARPRASSPSRARTGRVYHTYTVSAPDPFVAPYHSFLLDRTPKPRPEEPRAWRKDEYPD